MAEAKKGFRALEKRIHEIEEADRQQERQANERKEDQQKQAPRQEPPKK